MTEQSFGQALGQLIYRKRKAAGLTQMQLAEDAFNDSGKTRRVSELENGTVANPHLKTIDPIINYLRISDSELAECAQQAISRPDTDLDRAYREARNLIDAVAKQFEHSKPTASLSELDEFLRGKAKEWSSLRTRIEAIDVPEHELADLKSAANRALSEGDFDQVDLLLSKAEDNYQRNRTLFEVRKHAEIRITRGDNSLLRGNPDTALNFYLSAAEFFRPFDENEMVEILTRMAGQVYEIARRSFDPPFFVSARLLEVLVGVPALKNNPEEMAGAHYRLGLIYRNQSERSSSTGDLENAITHTKIALSNMTKGKRIFEWVSAQINLANCLKQRGKRTSVQSDLREAVGILRDARTMLEGNAESASLVPHVCNNLGAAILDLHDVDETSPIEFPLDQAIDAFAAAVKASEELFDPETWAAAKTNIGGVLAEKASVDGIEDGAKNFLRIRAISEYSAAAESYSCVAFPVQFASVQLRLARLLFEHAIDNSQLAEIYLFRSIQSYQAAASYFTESRNPSQWGRIQKKLGDIFFVHAQLDKVESAQSDCDCAINFYQEALRVFEAGSEEVKVCEHAIKSVQSIAASLAG